MRILQNVCQATQLDSCKKLNFTWCLLLTKKITDPSYKLNEMERKHNSISTKIPSIGPYPETVRISKVACFPIEAECLDAI